MKKRTTGTVMVLLLTAVPLSMGNREWQFEVKAAEANMTVQEPASEESSEVVEQNYLDGTTVESNIEGTDIEGNNEQSNEQRNIEEIQNQSDASGENQLTETEEEQDTGIQLTVEELELMRKVVSAESRGESIEAQYSVACVILNRMASEMFPDSLEEVIMQKGQFSCVDNGAIYVVPITDSVEQACQMALQNNDVEDDVLWFRSNRYHRGVPKAFQIGKLYFSQHSA